jgi:hypothetical protein
MGRMCMCIMVPGLHGHLVSSLAHVACMGRMCMCIMVPGLHGHLVSSLAHVACMGRLCMCMVPGLHGHLVSSLAHVMWDVLLYTQCSALDLRACHAGIDRHWLTCAN